MQFEIERLRRACAYREGYLTPRKAADLTGLSAFRSTFS
jgi:hypothetical protein